MIPQAQIIEWRTAGHPWRTDAMIEQDLLISRALIELFSDKQVRDQLIFRGGTALHKLFFREPMRYSEDIDLVQRKAEPIGPTFNRVREILQTWMGVPKRKQGPGIATLIFRLESEDSPPLPLKIKIEINTREHVQLLPVKTIPYSVSSRWFSGSADISVYDLHELLATKLRALYQRRKGRDLFDLAYALRTLPIDESTIAIIFKRYMEAEGHPISTREFRKNLTEKLTHPGFQSDCLPILRPGTSFNLTDDYALVDQKLLTQLDKS